MKWKCKAWPQGNDCFSSVLVTQSLFFFIISHTCSNYFVMVNTLPKKK